MVEADDFEAIGGPTMLHGSMQGLVAISPFDRGVEIARRRVSTGAGERRHYIIEVLGLDRIERLSNHGAALGDAECDHIGVQQRFASDVRKFIAAGKTSDLSGVELREILRGERPASVVLV